jgi:hypothetical protein
MMHRPCSTLLEDKFQENSGHETQSKNHIHIMYNFKVTVSVFWVAMLCATAISGYPEDEGNTFLSNTGKVQI